MPLKTYTKALPAYATTSYTDFAFMPSEYPTRYTTNMWSLIANSYRGLKNLVATSSAAGLLIPILFIFAGGAVLYNQIRPGITDQIRSVDGYYDQGTTSPVDLNYIADRLQYVSNPGADYFNKITTALQNNPNTIDQRTLNYAGTMYLSIPSLGFKKLPIKANVESTVKESYNSILTGSLAHFKGTSLPFADTPGNTAIYGHSASGSYHPSPTDVLAAFTFLPNLKVGDLIYLEAAGKTYTYRMVRSRVITPDDISVLESTPGRTTLTLLTCHPAGNSDHRYVAIAQLVS